MPPVIGGRRRRLKSISEYLISSNKPELEPVHVPTMQRPSKWQLRTRALFGDKIANINVNRMTSLFRMTKTAYITPQEAVATNPEEIMQQLEYVRRIDDQKLAEREQEQKDEEEKKRIERSMSRRERRALKLRTRGATARPTGTASSQASSVSDSRASSAPERRREGEGEEDDDNFGAFLTSHTEEGNDEDSRMQPSLSISANSLNSQTIPPPSTIGESVVRRQPTRHGYTSGNRPMQEGDVLPTGHVVKAAYPRGIAESIGEKYQAGLEAERKRVEDRKAASQARQDKRNADYFTSKMPK